MARDRFIITERRIIPHSILTSVGVVDMRLQESIVGAHRAESSWAGVRYRIGQWCRLAMPIWARNGASRGKHTGIRSNNGGLARLLRLQKLGDVIVLRYRTNAYRLTTLYNRNMGLTP